MRRQSREIALQTLFQIDFSPKTPAADLLALIGGDFDRDTLSYSEQLVDGVRGHLREIDALIQISSPRWKLERMAGVDRNLLRLATFEMVFSEHKVKPSIAINEAIEIAKVFGTTESSAFINGILDQVQREKGLST